MYYSMLPITMISWIHCKSREQKTNYFWLLGNVVFALFFVLLKYKINKLAHIDFVPTVFSNKYRKVQKASLRSNAYPRR